MRIFIAVRHRFAEDSLDAAIEQGVLQVVVLGAGLDTWSYRSPWRDRVRIFEVDHPATQEWKRQLLAAAEIPLPPSLTFAPVDFEQQGLDSALERAGFDRHKRTFFLWLGVVPYLTQEAVWSTLGFIGGVAGGAHVVFDYADTPESLPPERRATHARRAARVAEMGEAWLSYFVPEDLHARMTSLGFSRIEDLGPRQIASRYFPSRADKVAEKGGHVVLAATA